MLLCRLILSVVSLQALAGNAAGATLNRDGWSLELPRGCEASMEIVPAQPLYNEEEREEFARTQDHLKPRFNAMPAHLRVDMSACVPPHADGFFSPALYLIPVQSYLPILDPADDVPLPWLRTQLAQLQRWLADAPDAVNNWPFLPFLDMSPQFTVQRRALTFSGGRGIRLLTQFVPDASLAQSGHLSYVFQGLSTDGTYYVLLTMPLSLPGLAQRDDTAHLGFRLDDIFRKPEEAARYAVAVDALLRERAKELRPALTELDALVRSLRWKPGTPAVSGGVVKPASR
jgi:hypothetical protein